MVGSQAFGCPHERVMGGAESALEEAAPADEPAAARRGHGIPVRVGLGESALELADRAVIELGDPSIIHGLVVTVGCPRPVVVLPGEGGLVAVLALEANRAEAEEEEELAIAA